MQPRSQALSPPNRYYFSFPVCVRTLRDSQYVTQRQIVLRLEWYAVIVLSRQMQLQNTDARKNLTVPGRGLFVSVPPSSLF